MGASWDGGLGTSFCRGLMDNEIFRRTLTRLEKLRRCYLTKMRVLRRVEQNDDLMCGECSRRLVDLLVLVFTLHNVMLPSEREVSWIDILEFM